MRRCFDPWDLDIVKVIGFRIGAVLGEKSIDISMTGVLMTMLMMRKIEKENDDGDHGDETNSYDDYCNL